MLWWALAAGGILGSLARYGLSLLQPSTGWPWATFGINLSGAYVLALFLTLALERWSLPAAVRLGVGTGFVGSYTTFSTLVLETLHLVAGGHPWEALLYLHGSVAGGLLLAYAGHQTAMGWIHRRGQI
ncbi:MAG: CrcB family protein [Kyrpidia tusciae]|nr:CrcB family protein [Kyrpidia tusciae]MBE3551885.1 CrcB family protein [Kyrpidia tusciae]